MNLKARKALAELEALPGMHNVKEQVEQMIQFAHISKLRKEKGLKTDRHSNHMVFTGNPGTGKTTAARLIGKAFSALGIMEPCSDNPPFVEIHHADVESEFVGRAEKNITQKFKEAEGGVIFIDEIYTFLGRAEHKSSEKIVGALIQMMEDKRDSVVVIIAGYPRETEEFLRYNPGIRSRFSGTIYFEDYNIDDLMLIAEYICNEKDYKMTYDFCVCLKKLLWNEKQLPGFGNARTVRNLIEKSIKMQSVRLSKIKNPTLDDLQLLKPEDIKVYPNKFDVCK